MLTAAFPEQPRRGAMASVLHAALLLGSLGAARRLDEACVDDVEWHVQNRPWKDCAQLSRNHALCVKKNEDGTSGYDACPIACLACEGSEDSTTWYSNSKPQNDCAWIAKNADARCGKKDEDKVEAWRVRAPRPARRPATPTAQVRVPRGLRRRLGRGRRRSERRRGDRGRPHRGRGRHHSSVGHG